MEAEARFKEISTAVQRMTTNEIDSENESEGGMDDMEAAFQFYRFFTRMHQMSRGGGAFGRGGGGRGASGGPFGGMAGFPGPSGSSFGFFVSPGFFEPSGPGYGCSPPRFSLVNAVESGKGNEACR